MSSGRREIEDERVLLAELGRYVHLARADVKQQKIVRKAKSSASAVHADPQPSANSSDAPPARQGRRKRKSNAASSIWLTFKGAVSRMVPRTAPKVAKQQAFRRAQSVKRRVGAVTAAEQYFESALTQAKDAALDEEATDAYLHEQQHVAKGMLRKAPLGSHVADMAYSSGVQHNPISVRTGLSDSAAQRTAVASCIVRERVLVGDACDDAAQTDPLEEADVFLNQAAMILSHTEKKLVHDGGVLHDIVPAQCIIRIKNSGRRKQTAVISNQKAASLFKTNLGLLLRKEIAPLLHQHKEEVSAEEKKAGAPAGSTSAKKAPAPLPKAGGKQKK